MRQAKLRFYTVLSSFRKKISLERFTRPYLFTERLHSSYSPSQKSIIHRNHKFSVNNGFHYDNSLLIYAEFLANTYAKWVLYVLSSFLWFFQQPEWITIIIRLVIYQWITIREFNTHFSMLLALCVLFSSFFFFPFVIQFRLRYKLTIRKFLLLLFYSKYLRTAMRVWVIALRFTRESRIKSIQNSYQQVVSWIGKRKRPKILEN